MNVAHLLTSQAALHPDAPAIIEGCAHRLKQISFCELDDLSSRQARMLSDCGLGVGDHVLIFVPMSIDLYLALIAAFRIGVIATFLDPSAGLAHISQCCDIAKPSAMIASSKAHLLRLVSPSLRRIRHHFAVGPPIPGARSWKTGYTRHPADRIADLAESDSALVTFTSGSTGIPKAAARSHGFLTAQHHVLQQTLNLKAGEIDLATLPIFALANLASGLTTIIPNADLRRPGLIDAAPVLRQVRQLRPARSVASPAFFERLLDADDADALCSFNRISTGGAPVFPNLLDRLQRAMPDAQIETVYGSTEAEPISHITWAETSSDDVAAMYSGKGLLAGPPVPDIDLRIIANQWGKPIALMTQDEFHHRTLPAMEVGEIVVHGAHVLPGYLQGRGDEQSKFQVDDQIWHRTGDAGYLDPKGRVWLLGRAGACITDAHGTIYPFAVECAASRIENIRRSAMVSYQGKRVLVVEPRQRKGLDRSIAPPPELAWANIDQVVVLAKIPVDKRHNAKIDYPALQRLLPRCGIM